MFFKKGDELIMKQTNKLAISGMLIALGVILGSVVSIPVGVSKVFPMQHFINVISGVLLGPYYALMNAFVISISRNILGTGTLLAFPGSMIGALLAGILYKKTLKTYLAAAGELFGTGILGGILSYPIAVFLIGKETAVFFFVIPFLMSSLSGVLISLIVLNIPVFKKIIE